MAIEEEKEATPPKEPEATMKISVAKMQSILDRLDAIESESKTKDLQIEALKESVSKTRFDEAVAKQGADKRPRVSFKGLEGKAVIGWPKKKGPDKINEWVKAPGSNAVVGERIQCVYDLSDGTKTPLMDQILVAQSTEVYYARVINHEFKEGQSIVTVEFEDKSISEKPLQIEEIFLNHQ